MDILQYTFFLNALIGAFLASILCGFIGTYIVTRRLVFISGGITHASFGGIGIGVFSGINPILSAMVFAILSAFGVQWISRKKDVRKDSAIAMFWTLGMSVGIICCFLTPGFMPDLPSFLFGSILAIDSADLWLLGILTLVVALLFTFLLRPIQNIAFDSTFARSQHLPVPLIEYLMMTLIAMTIYGDLDVSVIDELPPGRKPIQTLHKFDTQLTSLYQSIRRQINLGRQVYIVFPLIKESEKSDLKNLEEGYETLKQAFPEFKLSKIHGKMKSAEKEVEMEQFVKGETQILVATTVIEVGVNVPNASVMVILDAQRFGLSQLHQLRGRVGRGCDQSYCILVTNYKLSEETRKRIDIMCDTNDGFRIAEADLKLRGPGDLEGTQQSGMAFDLKIANIARDGQLVQLARTEAQEIIDNDPECNAPHNALLWNRLRELKKTHINWAAIS